MARPTIIFALTVFIAIGFAQGKPRRGGYRANDNGNSNSNSNSNVNKNENIFSRRGLGEFPFDRNDDRGSVNSRKDAAKPSKLRANRGKKSQSSDTDELVRDLTNNIRAEFGDEAAKAFVEAVDEIRWSDRAKTNQRASRRNMNKNTNSNSNSNSFGARPESPNAIRETHQKRKLGDEAEIQVHDEDLKNKREADVDEAANIEDVLNGLSRYNMRLLDEYFEDDEDDDANDDDVDVDEDEDEDEDVSDKRNSNSNNNVNKNSNVNYFGGGGGSPHDNQHSQHGPHKLHPLPSAFENDDVDTHDGGHGSYDIVKPATIDYASGNGEDDYGFGIADYPGEGAVPAPKGVRAAETIDEHTRGKKKRRPMKPRPTWFNRGSENRDATDPNANTNTNTNSNINQFRRSFAKLRQVDVDDFENNAPTHRQQRQSSNTNSNTNKNVFRRNLNENVNENSNNYGAYNPYSAHQG